MTAFLVVFSYFKWHYSQSLKDALAIWRDFLLFFYRYFSLGVLAKTFFKPWRRMREYYSPAFDPQKFFEALIINTVLRLVGMVLKTAVIAAGIIAEFLAVFLGILILVFWFFAPVILIITFVIGIYFLI